MTVLHARADIKVPTQTVPGALHGVGLAVVNALSEFLALEIRRDGNLCFQEYRRGDPTTDLTRIGVTDGRSGTRITLKPDATKLGTRAAPVGQRWFHVKHDGVATRTHFFLACPLGLSWERAHRGSLDSLLAQKRVVVTLAPAGDQ
jgi:hypothetical protein